MRVTGTIIIKGKLYWFAGDTTADMANIPYILSPRGEVENADAARVKIAEWERSHPEKD